MNLVIRKNAAISDTAAWVNTINTDGAGDRWFARIIESLHRLLSQACSMPYASMRPLHAASTGASPIKKNGS
ncbi:MAG: hypothetical protein JST83_15600 [Bacteroidetes bacterium]|nr:hypothetical protein [Bacteroidota bacterium]